MKRILTVATAVATLALATAATAADLPVKAPFYQASPPVAFYNWTGCYVGVNLGGTSGTSNEIIPVYPANFDISQSGVTGGGHVGCNYMFAQNWVVGLEGDFDWTNLRGDELTTGVFSERYYLRWNWTASVRGRLGYTINNWLIYITGGGAWANLNSAYFGGYTVAFPNSPSVSGTHFGWTVGVGIEYGLTANWIVGIEYLFAQFDRKTYICSICGPVNFDLQTNTVRARLSYKF